MNKLIQPLWWPDDTTPIPFSVTIPSGTYTGDATSVAPGTWYKDLDVGWGTWIRIQSDPCGYVNIGIYDVWDSGNFYAYFYSEVWITGDQVPKNCNLTPFGTWTVNKQLGDDPPFQAEVTLIDTRGAMLDSPASGAPCKSCGFYA